MRRVERISSPARGGLPHSILVPPPRGITRKPALAATFSEAATSCWFAGSTTICGPIPSTASCNVAGEMCSGLTMERKSSHAASTPAVALLVDGGVLIRPSEKLRDSRDFQRMRLVGPGLFGAQAKPREDFAGIGELTRIEGAAHQLHRFQVRLGKHLRHHHLFLFAHSVFSSDRAAALNAQTKNVNRQLKGALFLARDGAVVEH